MKSLLERNKEFIIFLNKLEPRIRRIILGNLGSEYINTIAEIYRNFLQQNLTIVPAIIKKVHPHRERVRRICLKSIPLYRKKEILQSKDGGFVLNLLLPLAASLVTSLIAK